MSNFEKRYNIKSKLLSGEAASIDPNSVEVEKDNA